MSVQSLLMKNVIMKFAASAHKPFIGSTSDRMFSGKEETNMKKYEMPALELKVFALEDVIATSSCNNDCGAFDPNALPEI